MSTLHHTLPILIVIIGAANIFSNGESIDTAVVKENPWEEHPQLDEEWLERHEQYVNTSRENGDKIKILFIGSSSIEFWTTTGGEIWNEKYVPLGAFNYGLRGDRTQNVLWRIANGELDNIAPTLVVVYAGSNNIIDDVTVADVILGVSTLIERIQIKLPNSLILYLGFLPRLGQSEEIIDERWKRIMEVNGKISTTDFGENVHMFEMFWDFAESWGVLKDELYETDDLHLNVAGYTQWDLLWNSTFFDLLN